MPGDTVEAMEEDNTSARRLVGRHDRPERRVVEDAAREAVAHAEAALGHDPDDGPADVAELRGLDALERTLARLIDRAVEALDLPGGARRGRRDLAHVVLDLESARGKVRERRITEQLEALSSVQAGLDRLRAIHDMPTLLERTPQVMCEACGLERGVLSQVDGSQWTIESAYFDGDDEWAAEFVRLGRDELSARLDHLTLETEMVRRRAPALIHDAQSHPLAHLPLVEHADVRSYVSAPVMPEGRVIGFLHGDHYYSGHPVDTLDRDTIHAFARGFGHIIERAALLNRLQTQRQEVHRLLSSAEAVMSDLSGGEIQFHERSMSSGEVARAAAGMFTPPESRLEMLLTRRQTEILGLMAGGATNIEIANRLVIAPGTVKTHVKHILRKLRAANRAEAVSKYFRLTIGVEPGYEAEIPPDETG